MTRVRPLRPGDGADWLRMRRALWPEGAEDEHREEIRRFVEGAAGEPQAVLVAEGPDGRAVGFAELSIRPCAEGCRTKNVAYLEGWFVEPGARRRGVGRALIQAAERWARERGCLELASDTHPDNAVSLAAHRKTGFQDAGLIRCFRKDLA